MLAGGGALITSKKEKGNPKTQVPQIGTWGTLRVFGIR
jgi:hypothetical protein